jgi:hypothetical protein
MKGNRKFYVSAGALVLAFVLAMFGKLTGEFATIASVTVGAFTAANAFVHGAGQKGNKDGADS